MSFGAPGDAAGRTTDNWTDASGPLTIVSPKPRQYVARLALTDFRCYASARIDSDGRPMVLTGPNGAGKTNLLEALSFLAPGRGLRRARLSAITRQAPGEADLEPVSDWAINARLVAADGEINIGTGLDPDRPNGEDRGERRVVQVDGRRAKSQTMLGDVVHLTWLTPEMDRLFTDAAGERRRFVDRLVYGFLPGHASHLSTYERAMRERNRLLRDGRSDDAWLGALEQTMATEGTAIAAARNEVVGRLATAAELGISAFPVPDIALDGDTEYALETQAAVDVEADLRRSLHDGRQRDAEAGRALAGPHRTDLVVRHRTKNMPAALSSTGEQKALLVAIVLAAARLQKNDRGSAPLLLLDEIAAHLDESRRAALFDEICALDAQAWMTGTDPALFESLGGRAQFLSVTADHQCRPVPGA